MSHKNQNQVVSIDPQVQRNEQLIPSIIKDAIIREREHDVLRSMIEAAGFEELPEAIAHFDEKFSGYTKAFKLMGIDSEYYQYLMEDLGNIFWSNYKLEVSLDDVTSIIYTAWNASIREFHLKEVA